jgi:hypothetical protein
MTINVAALLLPRIIKRLFRVFNPISTKAEERNVANPTLFGEAQR